MNDVLNPVDAEDIIRKLGNRIAQLVPVVSSAEERMVNAKRALDLAEAHALLDAEGTVAERNAAVTLKVAKARTDSDVAYLAYRDAERRMRAVRDQLSAAQSVGRSVRVMYGSDQ